MDSEDIKNINILINSNMDDKDNKPIINSDFDEALLIENEKDINKSNITNNERPPPRKAAVNNSAIFQDKLSTGTDLIELVKSYPELYDKAHSLYCNNSHKGVIWAKIAKDLNVGSAKKTREQFSYMRKRFKTEYLARKQGLKRPLLPEPDSNGYRQPLFTYEQMAFLEPIIENEIVNGICDDVNFGDEFKPKEEIEDPPKLDFIGHLHDSLPSIDMHSPGRKRKSPGISSIPTLTLSNTPTDQQNIFQTLLKQLKDVPTIKPICTNSEVDDECYLFGKQVSLDLRGLNMKNRAVARYQINKVLMELLLEEKDYKIDKK